MAMRAVTRKISPSNIGFLEGKQLIPHYLGRLGSSRFDCEEVLSDSRNIKNSRESILEKFHENKKEIQEIFNKHDLCMRTLFSKEFKKEEQQRFIKGFQWMYLICFLRLMGFQTRELVSMKSNHSRRYCQGVGGVAGGIVEFSLPSLNLGSQSSKVSLLHESGPNRLPRQIVNGLICITSWNKEEFVIYNPSTGEKSPWIKTTVALEGRKQGEKSTREVECIAFGYDPTKNEHKVVCISTTLKKTSGITVAEGNAADALVVEVMTIDRNTWIGDGQGVWRRLCNDATPCAVSFNGLRFQLVDPVYVNGSIYWLFGAEGKTHTLAEFVVQSEEFQYCTTPTIPIIINADGSFSVSKEGAGAPLPTFQLMEFDGRVGVLKRISDYEACVYIHTKIKVEMDEDYKDYFHNDCWTGERIDWSEENISLPCAWTAGMHLSIEALTGTNLIFIQPERSDSLFCYDRKTKESVRFPILHDCERVMQL